MEARLDPSNGSCHACGATGGPLMKFSLGKDFFGRPYDRLSPSSDKSPKWYCEGCSMQKNLQRDFRDILGEFDKLTAGQGSTRIPPTSAEGAAPAHPEQTNRTRWPAAASRPKISKR